MKAGIIGQTKSGKNVYCDFANENHKDFTAQDHKDALKVHYSIRMNFGENMTDHDFKHHVKQEYLHFHQYSASKYRQYSAYLSNGGTMTMEEWERDGRWETNCL